MAVFGKKLSPKESEFRIEERPAKASKVRLNSLHQFSLLFLEKIGNKIFHRKFNSSPLKMDGWKDDPYLFRRVTFQGFFC